MKRKILAPAKINLFLEVLNKREDGYHNLRMIMQAISLYDYIEFEVVSKKDINYGGLKQINITSNFNYLPVDNKNLVYSIIEYIFNKYNITDKVRIFIKKTIPIGAGLGGGSSDAAAILKFLNKFYNLKLSDNELIDISLRFGSDIPFFISSKEAICEGRGEIITKIHPYKNYHVLIATPNIRISTKEIFEKYNCGNINFNNKRSVFEGLCNAISNKNYKNLIQYLHNDLEIVTEQIVPSIKELKARIMQLGGDAAMMSGSGPTVFGIFDSYYKIMKCKAILKNVFKEYFIFAAKPIK